MMKLPLTVHLFCLLLISGSALAQLSPGELAAVHSHLEGLSNCTKCHTLGDKVSNEKCLACHTEVKARIDQKRGYHSSAAVKGKACASCHNDHHGTTFQIVRFSKEKFDHNLAGFPLTGAHTKKACIDCHKPALIVNKAVKSKKFTYLGLSNTCNGCHEDYHQNTLSANCTDCHGNDAFKPAARFSHTAAKFQLTGKHQNVDCQKCHKVTTRNGKKFQEFTGIPFGSCINCHTDPHKNKFGPDCAGCHSGESFLAVKTISNFDHSKTNFPLADKHAALTCKACHKTSITDPLKHSACTDCHTDYHNRQLSSKEGITDCSACHSTKGFNSTSFTIEQHNEAKFRLEGAHLATPCLACHKKKEKWNFREIGIRCNDCHKNIHENSLDAKYMAGPGCENCHNPEQWGLVRFDHAATAFPLSEAHTKQSCRACHFRKDPEGRAIQVFTGLPKTCATCHTDIHNRQFENDGTTDCLRCHVAARWKIDTFDHDRTAFKLDGKHKNVPCYKCHKTVKDGPVTFTLYKIKDTRCESCHL
ncbi:MAG: DUF3716 domain-containing protein [Bacteroidetes bacterium]|nr:DUF3716 domain-containing protein [Bacteroidota bacterium]